MLDFRQLDRIEGKVDTLTRLVIQSLKNEIRMEKEMTTELQALTDQVKANEDLEASAIQLIQGIASQLAAAKEDPAAVQALSDSLKASADALASAVTANTPAA
jgi:hypothetical protein